MQLVIVYGKDGCGQMKPLIPFKTGKAMNQEKMLFMHSYHALDGKEPKKRILSRSSVNMVIDTIQPSIVVNSVLVFLYRFRLILGKVAGALSPTRLNVLRVKFYQMRVQEEIFNLEHVTSTSGCAFMV